MKMSITRRSVCSPNSHISANPVRVCQNGLSVSFFLFSWEVFSKNWIFPPFYFSVWFNDCFLTICQELTLCHGCHSHLWKFCVTLFLPTVPNDRRRTPITLLSAACPLGLFLKAKLLGARSVTILNTSFTDTEYFAFTATVKRSNQSSQYVLGAAFAQTQCTGNPDTADALPYFATSQRPVLAGDWSEHCEWKQVHQLMQLYFRSRPYGKWCFHSFSFLRVF